MNQHRVLLWVLAWIFIALVWALFDLQFAAVLDSFTSAIVLWRFAGIERNDSDFSEREQEKERRYVNKLFVRITLQQRSFDSLSKQTTFRDSTTGFPRQMTSEKRAQKLHIDDASLPRSGYCFWLVESNFPRGTTSQKHYPDLGSDASSVWNFCARFSDIIWREITSCSVTKCRLFSQASHLTMRWASSLPKRQLHKGIQYCLGIWILCHRFRIPGLYSRIFCQWNLDSGLQAIVGFRIP